MNDKIFDPCGYRCAQWAGVQHLQTGRLPRLLKSPDTLENYLSIFFCVQLSSCQNNF